MVQGILSPKKFGPIAPTLCMCAQIPGYRFSFLKLNVKFMVQKNEWELESKL